MKIPETKLQFSFLFSPRSSPWWHRHKLGVLEVKVGGEKGSMVGGHFKTKQNTAGLDSTQPRSRTRRVQLLPEDCLPFRERRKCWDRLCKSTVKEGNLLGMRKATHAFCPDSGYSKEILSLDFRELAAGTQRRLTLPLVSGDSSSCHRSLSSRLWHLESLESMPRLWTVSTLKTSMCHHTTFCVQGVYKLKFLFTYFLE